MSARRLLRDTSGAAALEIGLLAPVVFVLLLGLIQLGWGLHCASTVRWGLERSARNLLLNPDFTQAQLQADLAARVSNVAPASSLTVTLVREAAPGGQIARASATYDYGLAVPFVPASRLQFRAETRVPIIS